jgi:PIN domain nuclease of toxin-antitoxin system
MKYLLDTHTLLWSLSSPNKLSKKVKDLISQSKNESYVSAISLWEISLKYQLKKLELHGFLPEELPQLVKKSGFTIVNINSEIASTFYKLPRLHKDPFDRMLIWQAIKEDLVLVSKDKTFSDYEKCGLSVFW